MKKSRWQNGGAPGAVLLATILCLRLSAQTQAPESADNQVRVPVRITQAVDDANRVTLRGNVHRLARQQFDRGAIPDSQPANRMLLLFKRSQEQELALRRLLDEQQTKGSENFQAWLTPQEFGRRFGPADEDVQAVTTWLRTEGFQVGHLAAGRGTLEFTGSVGQVRNAFHTDVHHFVVNGKERFANISDPQIPVALAPVVAGITSLHNFPRHPQIHRAGVFQRTKKNGEIRPMFTGGGTGSSKFFALGPADFATIYNVPALVNGAAPGTNQTIAVIGDSNIDINDVRAYRTFFGLPAKDPVVILNGPDPGLDVASDEGEAVLDVELSGAVAPAAIIDLVIAENPTTLGASGVDLAALFAVDNNLAPAVSESFGDCEPASGGSNAFYSALWEQAAAQGITVTVSTGDSGSAGCDGGSGSGETSAVNGLAVSGIASTQFNVAVGGTDFDDITNPNKFWNTSNAPTTQGSALSYIPETTWNDSCAAGGSLTGCATVNGNGVDLFAGSGGPSSIAGSRPPWQTGAGVTAGTTRLLPDISLFASDGEKTNNFYFICQADAVTDASESCATSGTVEFLGAGGTSTSSPAFAAIMALVNQQTGKRQGNANYVLYKLAAQAGATCNSSTLTDPQLLTNNCVFYDTTKGNISVACQAGSPNCSNKGTSGTGVLVDPSNTSSPAWTTTPGYDRATGLGTVNVGNLLTKWTSVTFTGTTTALTGPSGTLTHGSAQNFTVTVTPSSATGDVALIAQPTSGTELAVGAATLSAGSATISTNMLPGGTYPVMAHYGGSVTLGGSDSPTVTVNVGKEASKTTLGFVTFDSSGNIISQSATTAAYGSPYIVRIDVTNSANASCSASIPPTIPCPTGSVSLTDNGSPLKDFSGSGTAVLNNEGFLEDQPIQLPVGSHALAASYAGDSSYGASSSATDTVSVTKAASSTSVASSATSVVSGASVTLTATVAASSSGVAPTGTVQFLNGSTPIAGTVTYAPTAGSASAPAGLKATLMTTISALAPPIDTGGRSSPPSPWDRVVPVWLLAVVMAFALRFLPGKRRLRHAYIYIALLFGALAVGFAGCGGGGGSSSTPSTKSVSINANYSGDANYSSSSGSISITVQ